MRHQRFKAKNLDSCSPCAIFQLFVKFQSCLNYARIIIYKECTRRQILTYVIKHIFTHITIAIHQQLTLIALSQRIFGNSLIGQRVVIFFYKDFFHVLRSPLNNTY